MTSFVPDDGFPGVPTKSYSVEDRIRLMQGLLDELRQAQASGLRPTDDLGNMVLGPDTNGAGWGIARPRIHVGAYPVTPDVGIPGNTFVVAYRAVLRPEAQRINLCVAYSTVEPTTPAGTCVGEYEVRWNKGTQPMPRGEGITSSILIDAWDSGTPGPKGNDGSLQRQVSYVYPQDGSVPLVVWDDPGYVCVSIWSRIRTGTGLVTDIAKVVPVWVHQAAY